eukprot:scaffold125391_cov24-Tisochrysis_lutea.AAC.1
MAVLKEETQNMTPCVMVLCASWGTLTKWGECVHRGEGHLPGASQMLLGCVLKVNAPNCETKSPAQCRPHCVVLKSEVIAYQTDRRGGGCALAIPFEAGSQTPQCTWAVIYIYGQVSIQEPNTTVHMGGQVSIREPNTTVELGTPMANPLSRALFG